MPARLILLCHAATAATRAAAFPADDPVEARALDRLAGLVRCLPRAGRWLTSPALPARQTVKGLGRDAAVEHALRECDYGAWSGRTLDAIAAEEPDAVVAWLADPAFALHGGETLAALLARVAAWLEAVSREAGPVVAVTHASILRAAVVQALGAPPQSFWRIDVAPLARLTLSSDGRRWTLKSLERLA